MSANDDDCHRFGFRLSASLSGHARDPEAGSRKPVLLLLRQPCQRCQLLQIFAHWLRRSSPERNALAAQNFVRQHAALAAEHDAFFDARMLADADLAAEHDAIFDYD